MECVDCQEEKRKYVNRAKWFLIDDIIHRQIRPLCDDHLHVYIHEFGEHELDFHLIEGAFQDPAFIQKINEKFQWYESMLKRLYDEIDKLKSQTNRSRDK